MSAGINMNRVCRHVKTRKGVVIEIAVGFECIPLELTDSVAGLSFIDGCKFKGTMDVSVGMSQIDIFAKGKEFVSNRVGFGRI